MSPVRESIRGEVPLDICGRSVAIAPTYRAIESIEVRLGIGIPALLTRALSGDIRIRDIAVVVYEGLRGAGFSGRNGAGDLFSIDDIGEDVLENLTAYSVAVGGFLGNALGGPLAKKEDAPDPESQRAAH